MKSFFYIDVSWIYFCISFGAMLLVALYMNYQSRYYYTLHVFVRKFTLIDLQSPASPLELATYIKGIYLLPPELSGKSSQALKSNLRIEFLFMPLAFGTIFLFCMQISMKLTSVGHWGFAILAWSQVVAWILGMFENVYLLNKIQPDVQPSSFSVHKMMARIDILKWAILLFAVVSGLSVSCYFWLTGRYHYDSVQYLMLFIAEAAVVLVFKKIADKTPKVNLDIYKEVSN
ncbi:MAG TPA: hypothetical protein VN726_12075 [Hanamia sp.]|nr:hypothetical protein [Hanamia sp.]